MVYLTLLIILVLNSKCEYGDSKVSEWPSRSLNEQLQYQECFYQALEEWKSNNNKQELPPQEDLDSINQECLKIEEEEWSHPRTTGQGFPEAEGPSSLVKKQFEQCLQDGTKNQDDLPKWPLSDEDKDLLEKCALDVARGVSSDEPPLTSEYKPPKLKVPKVRIFRDDPEFNDDMMATKEVTDTLHHKEQAGTAQKLLKSVSTCFEKHKSKMGEGSLTHDQVNFLLKVCHAKAKRNSPLEFDSSFPQEEFDSSSPHEEYDSDSSHAFDSSFPYKEYDSGSSSYFDDSEIASCSLPPEIPNGKAMVHGAGQDMIAHYKCINGFYHVVGDVLRCGVNGQWYGKIPTCLITGHANRTTCSYLPLLFYLLYYFYQQNL